MTEGKKFKARVRSRMAETGQRYTEARVAEEGRPVSVKNVAKLLIKRRSPGMSSEGTIMRIVKDFEQDHRGIGEVPRSWSVLMAWVLDILWPVPGSKTEDDEVIIKKIEGTLQAWLDGEIPWSVTESSAAHEDAARTHRDSLLHRDHVALANETIPEGLPESEPGDDTYFEDGDEEIFLETRDVLDGLWESAPDVREWFGMGGGLQETRMVLEQKFRAKILIDEVRVLRERLETLLGMLNTTGSTPELEEEMMRANQAVWKPMTPVELWAENQRLLALLKDQGIDPFAEE